MLPLLGTACKPSMDVDRGLALSLPACRRKELLAGVTGTFWGHAILARGCQGA